MEKPTTEFLTLGNLGIIAAIFKENKVIEKIDVLLPKTSNHKQIRWRRIYAWTKKTAKFSR